MTTKWQATLRKVHKQRMLYLFLAPALIALAVFSYTPMVGLIMAFQDYKVRYGFFGSAFVGLDQFVSFLTDHEFYNALKNTVGISLLTLVFGFPAPILLALLIDEVSHVRFKRICQTITYLPHFISWVVIATFVYRILEVDSGIANAFLTTIGLSPVAFMKEPGLFWPILILVSIWKEIGWNSIIYLAAIASIDGELYDAAKVDGAGRFRRVLHITLPCIAPTAALMLVLGLGTLFRGNFDAVFNLMNPIVMDKAEVIDTFVYRMGVRMGKYSYATAIGFAQSTVSLVLVWIGLRVAARLNGRSQIL